MTLRATAPAFVPSETGQSEQQQQHQQGQVVNVVPVESTRQQPSQQRRRRRRRRGSRHNLKTKSNESTNKKNRRQRPQQSQDEKLEISFPPLVCSNNTRQQECTDSTPSHKTRTQHDWLVTAERAISIQTQREDKLRRPDNQHHPQRQTTDDVSVYLTPLGKKTVCSSTTAPSSTMVEDETNHSIVMENSATRTTAPMEEEHHHYHDAAAALHTRQHNVVDATTSTTNSSLFTAGIIRSSTNCGGQSLHQQQRRRHHQHQYDITKLRNRWWRLMREKAATSKDRRNEESRSNKSDDDSSASSSSSPISSSSSMTPATTSHDDNDSSCLTLVDATPSPPTNVTSTSSNLHDGVAPTRLPCNTMPSWTTAQQQHDAAAAVVDRSLFETCLACSHPLHCAVVLLENSDSTNTSRNVLCALLQHAQDDNDDCCWCSWGPDSVVEIENLGICTTANNHGNINSNNSHWSKNLTTMALTPFQLAIYLDKSDLISPLRNVTSFCSCSAHAVSSGKAVGERSNKSSSGVTELALAIELGHEACVHVLLNEVGRGSRGGGCGSSPSSTAALLCTTPCNAKTGNSILHIACRMDSSSCSSILRSLLMWLKSGNTTSRGKQRAAFHKALLYRNAAGQTPLHIACAAAGGAAVEAVETLLAHCHDSVLSKLLRIQDHEKLTPLKTAIRAQSIDVVMCLLMWRVNHYHYAAPTSASTTALVGGGGGHSQYAPLTKNGHGANSSGWCGDDAVEFAAASACASCGPDSEASVEIVRLLLEFRHDARDYDLNAALQAAVRSSADRSCDNYDEENATRCDILRALIDAGANPCWPAAAEVINGLNFPSNSTALSIACAQGDVAALRVMLDAWQSHLSTKQIERRNDPKLCRQPEGYFTRIEVGEMSEWKLAMSNALVLSLFLGFSDNDVTTCRLACAICMFHRGAQLTDEGFSVLKASICSGRLSMPNELSSGDGRNCFAAIYRHPMTCDANSAGVYDRTCIGHWSQVLCSMPWMRGGIAEIQCRWIVAQRAPKDYKESLCGVTPEDRVVLIAKGGERFVASAFLLSLKSEKFAAAIRFEQTMKQISEGPFQIKLDASAQNCMWLLQHIYHGSIVSGWDSDPFHCALELLELAMIAEEYLCPSLVQECEMRLLSSNPFQCFCWSCCSAIRETQAYHDENTACRECLYHVRGPSQLLTAESSLDAFALSGQIMERLTENGCIVKRLHVAECQSISEQLWGAFDRNESDDTRPFAYIKDAAIEVCLKHFVPVLRSQTFLSHLHDLSGCDDSNQSECGNTDPGQRVQMELLHTCLQEVAASPLALMDAISGDRSRSNDRARSRHSSDASSFGAKTQLWTHS